MEHTVLGRTGLEVSVAGLGGGGGSRLGLARGRSPAEASDLVRRALDLGITLIDTAEAYGTEEVIGNAIAGRDRSAVVLATKHRIARPGPAGGHFTADEIVAGLDASLRRLRTDHVDLFQLHALTTERFAYAEKAIVPALLKERDKGKFRFLGATEAPTVEAGHEGLLAALDSDLFDVVMVAFQMFHQNARDLVFPVTMRRNVGTLLMFVVRSVFADPAHLHRVLAALAAEGKVPAALAEADDPLAALVAESGAADVTELAYRFGRHEPGADVVLFGTGDPAHLEENISSILAPPLPPAVQAAIRSMFGHLAGVGLELPGERRPG